MQPQPVLAAFGRKENNIFLGQNECRRFADKFNGDSGTIRIEFANAFNLNRVCALLDQVKAPLGGRDREVPRNHSSFDGKCRGEIDEKEIRDLFRRAGNEPLPKLREFATNLRLGTIRSLAPPSASASTTAALPLAKPAMPPSLSPTSVYAIGGSRSCKRNLPLKRAFTGPTASRATTANSVSDTCSSDSQPGMHGCSIFGSFKADQTAARRTGSTYSPFISSAIGISVSQHCIIIQPAWTELRRVAWAPR